MIRHLANGLRILGGRWWPGIRRWLGAGANWLDTGVRWALLLGAVYGGAQLLLGSLLRVAVVALAVCVMALRAATKAVRGQQPEPKTVPTAPSPAVEEGLPEVSAADVTALIRDLLTGAPGVHLATLAAALGDGWDTAAVRALLAAHQIPVRPSVRDAGRRVSPGVHRADLPPLPDPSPATPVGEDVAVVAAGQDTTTAPTTPAPTTPTTRRFGGVQVTSTPDPTNPARTHVRVVDPTRKRPA